MREAALCKRRPLDAEGDCARLNFQLPTLNFKLPTMNTDTSPASTLQPSELVKILDRFREQYPPGIVGYAIHPADNRHVEEFVRESERERERPLSMFCGPGKLIDPRIERGKAEVYFSQEKWLERCKEQQEFDAALPSPSALSVSSVVSS